MSFLDLNSATASLTGVGTFGALAAVTGDTLTVRSLGQGDNARLVGFGRKGATAGSIRLRSPFLHDVSSGIRSRVLAADPSSVIDSDCLQPLRAQDPLTFESTGGAAAEQESGWILTYYGNLQGDSSVYISAAELEQRALELVTLETAVTGVAPANWGSTLLSAATGQLKANQWYAVLGYQVDVACTAVALSGPDTGNFKVGGPGITTRQFTRRFFHDLADQSGLPVIPCINAQNLGGTTSQIVDSAGATAVNVDWILARLRK